MIRYFVRGIFGHVFQSPRLEGSFERLRLRLPDASLGVRLSRRPVRFTDRTGGNRPEKGASGKVGGDVVQPRRRHA